LIGPAICLVLAIAACGVLSGCEFLQMLVGCAAVAAGDTEGAAQLHEATNNSGFPCGHHYASDNVFRSPASFGDQ